MPSHVTHEVTPQRVTPWAGEGAPGKWRAYYGDNCPGTEPENRTSMICRAGDITVQSGGVCGRTLNLRIGREGSLEKCHCCQPESGNPTFRDDRGACGNVGHGGIRNPLHIPKGCMNW
jgi:hypothetical protein